MVQVLVEKLTEARRSYRLQPTNMSIEQYLLSCKLNPLVISLACTVKKKDVAFFGFSFLVTIVDPNLADGEGDGDVRGERGHCSLCWMADVKVANGYVCDCGGFTV